MAKSCVRLTEGSAATGSGTTNNSASISPAASSAVVIGIFAFNTTTMSVSGNGLTWSTKVNGELGGDGGRLWVFIGAGSPSTGVVTFTYQDGATLNWAIDNITGTVDLATPGNSNFAAATGTSTAPATTLAAFAGGSNGVWAYIYAQDAITLTPGTGFTTIDSNVGTALFGHSDYSMFRDSNDTSVDGTLSGSAIWGIAALEILDAGGGGGGSTLMKKMRRYL